VVPIGKIPYYVGLAMSNVFEYGKAGSQMYPDWFFLGVLPTLAKSQFMVAKFWSNSVLDRGLKASNSIPTMTCS
jgi:hypothetical protein